MIFGLDWNIFSLFTALCITCGVSLMLIRLIITAGEGLSWLFLMSFFLISIGVLLTLGPIAIHNHYTPGGFIPFLGWVLQFLQMPFLYLVFKRLFDKDKKFSFIRYTIIFLLPSILFGLSMTNSLIHKIVYILHATAYFILLGILISKFITAGRIVEDMDEEPQEKSRKLSFLLWIIFIPVVVFIMNLWLLQCIIFIHMCLILLFMISGFIVFSGINELNRPDLLKSHLHSDVNKPIVIDVLRVIENGGSHSDVKDFNRLENYMRRVKPWKDPELTLPVLAAQLKMTRCRLSFLINSQANGSFFSFVNGFRIGESLKFIEQNPDMNILDVAYDSGFSAKSTFYKAFKEKTGKSPRAYRNGLRSSDNSLNMEVSVSFY